MPYLVHAAHAQLLAFWLAAVGWILITVSAGLVEWRVWEVSDRSDISSGLAWVGIWRACFYSHAPILSANQIMFCQRIRVWDSFTPAEISAAQVLLLLALVLGLLGNASVVYGLRNVYFGLKPIRLAFGAGGVLFVLTGASALVPVCWNLSSVLNNETISFPESFHMPAAPLSQSVGPGIIVGAFASVLVVLCGLVFLSYRVPRAPEPKVRPFGEEPAGTCWNHQGLDNPAFQTLQDT